jgi:hypothetical protein
MGSVKHPKRFKSSIEFWRRIRKMTPGLELAKKKSKKRTEKRRGKRKMMETRDKSMDEEKRQREGNSKQ